MVVVKASASSSQCRLAIPRPVAGYIQTLVKGEPVTAPVGQAFYAVSVMPVGALDACDTKIEVAKPMNGLGYVAGGVAAKPAVLDAGLAVSARASA